ncbi:hypothetical protein NDN01_20360 [Sphingomonas sp. QA11]|uniref:hypothetical protein n=1 Tax=Sphingomonas sp. QA11 TaxID=2950605 RepID=UPI00234B9B58|nr:hypothetical protein [Sphingomonas sp. QA11]WCM26335.1 hypothetical protein NDN01_20360 [Sphingomonas sp. QA11]
MTGPAAQTRSLEDRVEAELNSLIVSIGYGKKAEARLDYLIEKVRKRRGSLTVKPEFTPEVVGIAKQIVAFGAAGLSFALAFGEKIPANLGAFSLALMALYANVTIVSLLILIWFFAQARTRYPWLYLHKLGNSSKYFYYAAEPLLKMSYRPFYLPAGFRDRGLSQDLERYLENLSSLSRETVSENKKDELRNELIQYHLLIVYQGYLDQYEQQLTHLALYGFIGSAICAMVVLALGLI